MSKRMTTQEFIEKAEKIHGNKYRYDKVVYVNSSTKVVITCPIHGDFSQTPFAHLNGQGCKLCGVLKRSMERKLGKEEFIRRSNIVHNNKYGYDKTVYVNTCTKVVITCPIHGDFEQTPCNHLKGCGCSKCSHEEAARKTATTQEDFLRRAKKIHGDKYDYTKVVYKNMQQHVCIICRRCGREFWQSPIAHLHGNGCPLCGNKKRGNSLRKSFQKFIIDAQKIHGDEYDYSLINKENYKNCHTPVPIICQKHGVFYQTPSNHLKGCGCPHCKKSFGEERVSAFLTSNEIKFIYQHKVFNESLLCSTNMFYIDFYLPECNVFIEYNGEQHYRPIKWYGGENKYNKQKERDYSVKFYCKQHKIKLIEIPYNEYDNIEKILKKELKTKSK